MDLSTCTTMYNSYIKSKCFMLSNNIKCSPATILGFIDVIQCASSTTDYQQCKDSTSGPDCDKKYHRNGRSPNGKMVNYENL